jgi:hypothetical protein
MGVEHSTGSLFPVFRRTTMNRFSTIGVSGGVGYLQGRASTGSQMVYAKHYLGDICHGSFKNGLKHGEGHEQFSNGDSYHG